MLVKLKTPQLKWISVIRRVNPIRTYKNSVPTPLCLLELRELADHSAAEAVPLIRVFGARALRVVVEATATPASPVEHAA